MWSLGGVAATLLSGAPIFVDSKDDDFKTNPDESIAKLAAECNLTLLDQREDWQHVGDRAKDFVRRLLVLDEMKRMTVKEALEHPWFTNEHHRKEFEAVYLRAIRYWKPRPKKADIIEILNVDKAKEGPSPKRQRLSPPPRPSKKRVLMPTEPPEIPFHRHINNLVCSRREPEFLPARSYVPAPWQTPVGWISSLHDVALLERTDLASVKLPWLTASKPMTPRRKLESRFLSPHAPDTTTAVSPGTEASSSAWAPASSDTDEEDELALVPTSSPGRNLLALLDHVSMKDTVYPTRADKEEEDELADVAAPSGPGKLMRPSKFAERAAVSPATANIPRENKKLRGISIYNFEDDGIADEVSSSNNGRRTALCYSQRNLRKRRKA